MPVPMREVDLAIIGAGVAGLTAATVAAQHGLTVLVIERMGAGGQVMNVEAIHNMPGFPQGISGFELGPLLQEQAEAAGAEFMLDTVLRLEVPPIRPEALERHILHCESDTIAARAVLVAAGSVRRKLDVPGEEMEGRGVSHCASCDGPLFRGKPVCVVGGGDSAFGEAAVLATHAHRVTLVFREAQPHAQKSLVNAVAGLANVQLIADAEVNAILGDDGVTGVRLLHGDGTTCEVAADGVFIYAGLAPASGFLEGTLRLDAAGRIVTDAHFASSLPGVFAAGDIRAGAGWLLARLPGEIGAWMALAGARLKAADCLHLKLCTHYVPSDRLERLKAALIQNPEEARRVLARFSDDAGLAPLSGKQSALDAVFGHDSVEAILEALDGGSSWAREQAAILRTKSPTSMKVALRQLRTAHERPAFADEMRLEFRIACRIIASPDFQEGVRAVVVDKDNAPRWSPARLEDVNEEALDALFAPFADAAQEWTPLD